MNDIKEQAIEAIEDFLINEYGGYEFDDFDDLTRIPVAFLEGTEDEEETQVSIDIINQCVITEVGDDEESIEEYESGKDFIEMLKSLDFNDLIQTYS